MGKKRKLTLRGRWEKFKKSETYIELKKRIQSFIWRAGIMVIVGFLDLIIELSTEMNTDNTYIVIIALILGEITKHLENKYNINRKIFRKI